MSVAHCRTNEEHKARSSPDRPTRPARNAWWFSWAVSVSSCYIFQRISRAMGTRRSARPLCDDTYRCRVGQRIRARRWVSGGRRTHRRLGAARDDGARSRSTARSRPARDGAGAVRRAAGAGAGHSDPAGYRRRGPADAGGGDCSAQRLGRGQGAVPDRQPAPGPGGGDGRRDAVHGAGRRDAGVECGRDAMVGAGGGVHAAGRGRVGAAVFFRDPAAATRRGRTEKLDPGVGS